MVRIQIQSPFVRHRPRAQRMASFILVGVPALSLPGAAFAQAGSPFDTGAQGLLTFALAIAAPVAALIIIGVCIAAATSLISWGWVVRCIAGIAGIFGAVQIVAWIRGMFGV
jgi:type IV secretory pathway VirB2 component (pilin)